MFIIILLSSIEYNKKKWILSLHNRRVALLLKVGGTHNKEGTLQNPENPYTLEGGVRGGGSGIFI